MKDRFPAPERGLTGNAIWTVDGHDYVWNGPGSGLFLVFGDRLVRIDHPSADGIYPDISEASDALYRFVSPSLARHRVLA